MPSAKPRKRPTEGRLPGAEAEPVATTVLPAHASAKAAWHLATHFGNEVLTDAISSEPVGGLGPLLAFELSVGLAGVETTDSSPLSSNAVMLRKMRRARDYDASHPSLARLAPTGGEPLAPEVKDRMEAAFGHDFSHVRIHVDGAAAQQSLALHAHAFTLGSHVFFGPGEFAPGTPQGDRLLAHELTHVRQHDQGRIGTASGDGLDVSSPADPLEREAYANEAHILAQLTSSSARAENPAMPAFQAASAELGAGRFSGGQAVLRDEAPSAAAPTAEEAGPGEAPEKVTLTLAGRAFEFQIGRSETTEEERDVLVMQVTDRRTLAPGVETTGGRVEFDASWNVVGGALDLSLTAGEILQGHAATVTIDDQARIAATIQDVPLSLTDLAEATIDVEISTDGIRAQGTFSHDKVRLGDNFEITGGSVTVLFDTGAETGATASASGTLTGRFGDFADFTLATRMDENRLVGRLDLTLQRPVPLAAGVEITGCTLGGELEGERGGTLTGSIHLAVRDWATGDITATYALPASDTAEAGPAGEAAPAATDAPAPSAPAEAEAGEQAPSGGEAPAQGAQPAQGTEAAPAQGAQAPAEAAPEAAGATPAGDTAQGASQGAGESTEEGAAAEASTGIPMPLTTPGPGRWSFSGTLRQAEDFRLDETTTVTGGAITIAAVDNSLTAVGATATLRDPPFDLVLTGTYNIAEERFDGTARVTVTEPQPLGRTGLTLTAATGTVTVTAGELGELNGSVKAEMSRRGWPRFELRGEDLSYDFGTELINGRAEAELLEDYDLGTAGDYSIWAALGSTGTATVTDSVPSSIAGTLKLRVDKAGGEEGASQAFLEGDLSGSYDIAAGHFSGTGTISPAGEEHLFTFGADTVWLSETSVLSATVTESDLTEISGDVTLVVKDAEEEYLSVGIDGGFDLAGRSGFDGEGTVTVSRDKRLLGTESSAYSFWLATPAAAAEGEGPQASMTAHLQGDSITKIDGTVPFMIKDRLPEALITGAIQGEYTTGEQPSFSGSGTIALARDLTMPLGSRTLKIKAGSGGTGHLVDSELTSLDGTFTVEVLDAENQPEFRLTGSGEYDAQREKLVHATGTVTMLRTLQPFGANVVDVDGLSGTVEITNNELSALTGEADLTLPSLPGSSGRFEITWSRRGDEDRISGSGDLHLVLIPENDVGRSAEGDVTIDFSSQGTFGVDGTIGYNLTEDIGGTLSVDMDQEMDPAIGGTLHVSTDLVEAADLFAIEIPVIPGVRFAFYEVVYIEFGAQASMSLGMRALALTADIGITDWHPLGAQGSEVPNFSTDLDLTWGLDFEARAGAWLEAGLMASRIASVGAGILGEVVLNAPLEINPYGRLEGGADGFRGELGVGVSLSAGVSLVATPYVQAEVTGMDPYRHDFDPVTEDLGELFSFEWGTTYVFGDTQERLDRPTQPVETPAAQQSREECEEPAPASDTSQTPRSSPGGPQFESGDEIAGETSGEGQMAELQRTLEDVRILSEGIGALFKLVKMVVDLLMAYVQFGPPGFIVQLAWDMVTGDITVDGVASAVRAVIAAVDRAAEMLAPHMPDWWATIQDFVNDPPSIYDAFFGADDRMREAVANGDHLYGDEEMWAQMIDVMLGGACWDDDENAILTILRHASSQGKFISVVRAVGVYDLDGALDGDQFDDFVALCRANGIEVDLDWGNEYSF